MGKKGIVNKPPPPAGQDRHYSKVNTARPTAETNKTFFFFYFFFFNKYIFSLEKYSTWYFCRAEKEREREREREMKRFSLFFSLSSLVFASIFSLASSYIFGSAAFGIHTTLSFSPNYLSDCLTGGPLHLSSVAAFRLGQWWLWHSCHSTSVRPATIDAHRCYVERPLHPIGPGSLYRH